MWQWHPEIRACPGSESPRSLLQPPGHEGLWKAWETPRLCAFLPPGQLPVQISFSSSWGQEHEESELEGAEGGY